VNQAAAAQTNERPPYVVSWYRGTSSWPWQAEWTGDVDVLMQRWPTSRAQTDIIAAS